MKYFLHRAVCFDYFGIFPKISEVSRKADPRDSVGFVNNRRNPSSRAVPRGMDHIAVARILNPCVQAARIENPRYARVRQPNANHSMRPETAALRALKGRNGKAWGNAPGRQTQVSASPERAE
jgi:hypothetical protein